MRIHIGLESNAIDETMSRIICSLNAGELGPVVAIQHRESSDRSIGNLSATWKWITAKFNYSFSDYFGASKSTGFTDNTDGTYYLQLDAAYPLPQVEGLSLVGHVGYTHYSNDLATANANGKNDPSYTDWKLGVSYVLKDGWTLGAYYIGTNNTDFYKHTLSLANSDVKNLGGSGGYVTVGRTF